jgi:hypothetical protein
MPTQKEIEQRKELMRKIKDEVVDLKESFLQQQRIKNKVHPGDRRGQSFR